MEKKTKIIVFSALTIGSVAAIYFLLKNSIPEIGLPDLPGSSGKKYPEGTLLRAGTDSKIYIIDAQGYKHWITTRAKFDSAGLSMANVKSITSAELNAIPDGGNLSGVDNRFQSFNLM